MSQAQLQEGLRRLTERASDFETGAWDPERECIPLRSQGRLVARVSREVLEDWPADGNMGRIVDQGLRLAREEAQRGSSRIVSIATTGCQYE